MEEDYFALGTGLVVELFAVWATPWELSSRIHLKSLQLEQLLLVRVVR